jgi:N-acetylneuraminate lyase
MDSAGKPALDVLEKLIDLFAEQRLDGLYAVGSTGQWPLLSVSERMAVGECIIRTAAGRLPVMLHVGSLNTPDAVTLAKHAEKIGADAISTVAPSYYGYSANVVFDYYRKVGAATSLPLYVYHLSSVHQLKISTKEYVSRLLELPNIAGMKITDVDLYLFGLIHSYSQGKLRLFSGADEVMCQAVISGAIGAIGTFYNLWGPTCQKARNAMAAGEIETAAKFMHRFQIAVDEVISSGSIWSFMRAALRLEYGLDIGMPREPLGALDKPWADGDVRRLVALVNDSDVPKG